MPTVIQNDILKFTDKNGRDLKKVNFVDPENPLVLIDPEIGRKYEATVYLKNDSEYACQFVRLLHHYEDVKIEPSYIEFMKPSAVIEVKITWKPFTSQGIEEKVKRGKVSINIQPSCTVVVEQ